LYLFLYFFAYHLATSGVPPAVRVPPVKNRWSRLPMERFGVQIWPGQKFGSRFLFHLHP